jgi:transcriptional regulator with XRE-family HTH domain
VGFRENLKSQLEYSGMLVKELAAATGIKKKTLDSYLGKQGYKPSVDTAVSIAKALGVSVEYLVTGQVDKNDRRFSSLPAYLQEILDLYEQLSTKDRFILLNIAKLLKNR